MVVNKLNNNWSLIPVQTTNGIALRKDSDVQPSSERHIELINREKKTPHRKFYSWEKGSLIDVYA